MGYILLNGAPTTGYSTGKKKSLKTQKIKSLKQKESNKLHMQSTVLTKNRNYRKLYV